MRKTGCALWVGGISYTHQPTRASCELMYEEGGKQLFPPSVLCSLVMQDEQQFEIDVIGWVHMSWRKFVLAVWQLLCDGESGPVGEKWRENRGKNKTKQYILYFNEIVQNSILSSLLTPVWQHTERQCLNLHFTHSHCWSALSHDL